MQRPRTKKNFGLGGVEILAGPIGITLPMVHLYPGGLEGSLEAGLGEAGALWRLVHTEIVCFHRGVLAGPDHITE